MNKPSTEQIANLRQSLSMPADIQITSYLGSGARAHIKAEDDALVRVRPMLDRVNRWNASLSDAIKLDKEELIELHARTGKPLGNPDFIRKLEFITGEQLAPKRPGRKSPTSK